jgi:hypothetical protein
MNKIFLFFIAIIIGTSVSSQKLYQFDKIGTIAIKVKAEGTITINDSTLTLVSTFRGKTSQYTLKIVSKDENDVAPTYNCIGQIGVSDKQQFSFILSKNMVIWTGYNSFDNSKVEQFMSLKKSE